MTIRTGVSFPVALFMASLTFIVPSVASAETVYLEADFEDKTIDMPIGTGGAAMGEPVEVDETITAIVRDAPMSSPCLELHDADDFSSGSAVFELTNSTEVTTGLVAMTCNLWFFEVAEGHAFLLHVREQGGAAFSFLTLHFRETGDVRYSDANTTYTTIGTYEVGRPSPLHVIFDMDAGTYDVLFDGIVLLDDEDHGISERGVGSFNFGCRNDADLDGRFCIDDIYVADTYTPAPVEPATWGRLKALFD